ncbi:MAG: hypothetical protein ACTSYC_08550 [Promethearchaeota archaeon]
MSLDKWLKKEPTPSKKSKKPEKKKEEKEPNDQETKKKRVTPSLQSQAPLKSLEKHIFFCSKCKYQKIVRKSKINEKDKTCPKCKKIMKEKS